MIRYLPVHPFFVKMIVNGVAILAVVGGPRMTGLAEDVAASAKTTIEKRMITFRSFDGKLGFVNEDGSNEIYPDLPYDNGAVWFLSAVYPDKQHGLFTCLESYSLDDNLSGRLSVRHWKTNFSTGERVEILTRNRPGEQVFCASPFLADGKSLLCSVTFDGGQPLFVVDTQTDVWTRICDGFVYGVSTSPDQTQVAFHVAQGEKSEFVPAGYSINTCGIDGTGRQLVIGRSDLLCFAPVWRPDGQWLAFVVCRHQEDPAHYYASLWIAAPDGTRIEQVTEGQTNYFGTVYGPPERRGGGSNTTVWSPDGKYLLYTKLSPGAHPDSEFTPEQGDHKEDKYDPTRAKGGCSLVRLDPFTKEEIPITTFAEGRWDFRGSFSADGRKVVYTSAKNGCRAELFVCDVDGENTTFISAGAGGSRTGGSEANNLGAGDFGDGNSGVGGLGADHPRWIEIQVEPDSPWAK